MKATDKILKGGSFHILSKGKIALFSSDCSPSANFTRKKWADLVTTVHISHPRRNVILRRGPVMV